MIVSSISSPDVATAPKTFDQLVSSEFNIAFAGNDILGWKVIQAIAQSGGQESLFGKMVQKIKHTYPQHDLYLKVDFHIFLYS